MKEILFSVFKPLISFGISVIFHSLLHAQTSDADTSRKPFITQMGKPFGNIASAKIDSKGGKLKSADGGLEVIIPDNALDSETTISIQSTHNDLSENNEGAYQLEPSGIIFKKPAKLVFHYTEGNDNADLMRVGWQDDKGQWHRSKAIAVDTIQRTITMLTSHFSKWAKFNRMYITPAATSLRVNKSLKLIIKVYPEKLTAADDDDLLAPPYPASPDDDLVDAPTEGFHPRQWTANGVVNGDKDVGVITSHAENQAVYNAPSAVPDNNPVSVSVEIYSDKKTKELFLTSSITVIGGKYHFTYIHIDEGDGCFALVDSSSCIVNLDTENPTITNINNYRPFSDWPNCSKGCKTEWTNKESVKGMVQIEGLASSSITPPVKKGGATSVYIALVPAIGNTASAIEHCKDGDHTIPSHPFPADPKYISFDIVDKDNLTIHFGGKSGPNELVLQGHNEKTMIYMYRVN